MSQDITSVTDFSFEGIEIEQTSHALKLSFNFKLGAYRFKERLSFPLLSDSKLDQQILVPAINYLSIMLGISYYKLASPSKISVDSFDLSQDEAGFFDYVYFHGLQEYAFRNKIDLKGRIRFPFTEEINVTTAGFADLSSGVLIPMGGGKDSMLCLEMLKTQNPLLFTLDENPQVQQVSQKLNLPLVAVRREIDPLLFELNKRGGLNGHVPFSAILAFVSVVVALLYRKKYIVLGNERSANEANVYSEGVAVNHQFSKSWEFERRMNIFVKQKIHPDIEYFSLLRQFSEAHIARELCKHEQYLDIFSSCNQVKKQGSKRSDKWCGLCSKCCFVFLCLAPFVSRQKLCAVFGGNLLDNKLLEDEFRRLTGLLDNKPWECVGEQSECRELLRLAARDSDHCDSYVVKKLQGCLDWSEKVDLFSLQGEHNVPVIFKRLINELP